MANKNKKNQRVGQLIADAGKKLSGNEVQQIAKKTGYTPESIVNRAEKTGVKIKPSAQDFVQQALQAQAQPQAQAQTQAQSTAPVDSVESAVANEPFSDASVDPLAGTSTFAEIDAANIQALQRIADEGKINLQKIVNAGYRNIARIERGAQMVGGIYSMFNF